MIHPKVSKKRAKALSTAIFFISIAVISFTARWWPDILLAIAISLSFRQLLLGRIYDAFLSLVIFVGAYIAVSFEVSFDIILPVIFLIAGLYILVREFSGVNEDREIENEEDISKEIEEDKENEKD